jgi:galactonate dehydratase
MTAIKMNGSGPYPTAGTPADTAAVLDRAALVREVLGPHRDMAIDFHGRISATDAKRLLPGLAELHPLFVEEPVLPEHSARLPEIVACSSVPIAYGERLYSRSDFLAPLQSGIAVAQPDLSHAGGITEVRRIAALAETYDVLLAPHCPLGPIALAASLQLAFTTPNFLIQEQSIGIHYNAGAEVLDWVLDRDPFRFVDGHVALPPGPGLGVEIDEAAVREADRAGHSWRNPIWRDETGAFTEW